MVVLFFSKKGQQHFDKLLFFAFHSKTGKQRVLYLGLNKISVTRCWSKKEPNFFQKLRKK